MEHQVLGVELGSRLVPENHGLRISKDNKASVHSVLTVEKIKKELDKKPRDSVTEPQETNRKTEPNQFDLVCFF